MSVCVKICFHQRNKRRKKLNRLTFIIFYVFQTFFSPMPSMRQCVLFLAICASVALSACPVGQYEARYYLTTNLAGEVRTLRLSHALIAPDIRNAPISPLRTAPSSHHAWLVGGPGAMRNGPQCGLRLGRLGTAALRRRRLLCAMAGLLCPRGALPTHFKRPYVPACDGRPLTRSPARYFVFFREDLTKSHGLWTTQPR